MLAYRRETSEEHAKDYVNIAAFCYRVYKTENKGKHVCAGGLKFQMIFLATNFDKNNNIQTILFVQKIKQIVDFLYLRTHVNLT